MAARKWARRFLGRDDGTTAAEYAVLLALIVLATAAAMWALGPAAGDQVGAVGTAVGTPADP
jgi:Flp pilus assembly pilin Flp